jgi:hypothetical protein
MINSNIQLKIKEVEQYISLLEERNTQLENNLKQQEDKEQEKIISPKALLIGINYKETKHELRGCINDVKNIRNRLNQLKCFDNFTILTDETEFKPTRENILKEFKSLCSNAKAGETLFFSFSGHGSYTFDRNNEEKDKRDECIVSVDSQMITDDEINNILTTLPKNSNMIMIFDCCHSGTIADLKYSYVKSFYNKRKNNNKNNILANVISISGCMDNQTSADAYIQSKFQGAMTFAFLKYFSKNITINTLLSRMRYILKRNKFTQYPIISSSKNLSKYQRFNWN